MQRQPHRRLTGGVDQEAGIGQGNQRPGDQVLAGKQGRGPQFLQQPGTGVELVARADGGGCLLVEQGNDLVHQRQLLLLPLGFGEGGQSGFAQLAHVAGQALGGFGGVEGLNRMQALRLADKVLMIRLAEQAVMKAGGEVLRGHGVVAGRGLVQS